MSNRPPATAMPDGDADLSWRHGLALGSPRALFIASASALVVALLAGGANGALNHLLVQLAVLPLVFLLLADRSIYLTLGAKVALACFALAALQLVPLPPVVWTAFPGRDQAAGVLAAAGMAPGWRPLALDPGAAAMALATLVAPVALYVAVGNLDWAHGRRLLAIIGVFGALSAILGLFQRIGGDLSLYGGGHRGYSTGLMINRNHHADLIVAAALLFPLVVGQEARLQWRVPLSAAVVALGLSVVATTSRLGMVIAVPALLVSLVLLWRVSARLIAPFALGLAACIAMLSTLPAYSTVFARFAGSGTEERLTMADNTLVAMRHFWPWGSGYGSFVPVYRAFEDLDRLGENHVVAAHNDFLQILLEGGLPGLLTILAGLVAIGWIGWRAWRVGGLREAWAAYAVVILILVHSLFDFPLRMAAVAAVFAVCLGAVDAMPRHVAKTRVNT